MSINGTIAVSNIRNKYVAVFQTQSNCFLLYVFPPISYACSLVRFILISLNFWYTDYIYIGADKGLEYSFYLFPVASRCNLSN